ncbi:MAG: hypothetical protein MZV63_66385 [Marinilabiliales bacterium]|nr:hypothetical protein [Marinilabiliales bacterium]
MGFLAVAAAAGLGLVTSCNIAGSGGTGPTGSLNLLLTDGPTDEWSQVVVVLKSVSLRGNSLDGGLEGRCGRSGRRQDQPRRLEHGRHHPAEGRDPRRDVRQAPACDRHRPGDDDARHRRRRDDRPGRHHGRRSVREGRDRGRPRAGRHGRGGQGHEPAGRLRPGPSAVHRQPGREGHPQPQGAAQGAAAPAAEHPVRPDDRRHHRGRDGHDDVHRQDGPGRRDRLQRQRQHHLRRRRRQSGRELRGPERARGERLGAGRLEHERRREPVCAARLVRRPRSTPCPSSPPRAWSGGWATTGSPS